MEGPRPLLPAAPAGRVPLVGRAARGSAVQLAGGACSHGGGAARSRVGGGPVWEHALPAPPGARAGSAADPGALHSFL